jgi:amidohydrolase
MHACGHDGHMATLLGTAAILNEIAAELPVCVKLLWQPAEEGGAGADRLVAAGVLDGRIGPPVRAIFGLHGYPGMQVGQVATRPGPLMAATDNYRIAFIGKGCHGAFPHTGVDPIVAAAEAVVNLQQVASRDIDPAESVVVTVGMIHGGTAVNIIPDEAVIEGTARTLTEPLRKQVQSAIRRRCEGIAAACGCRLDFAWTEGYAPTVNDPAMADYVARIARAALGPAMYANVPKPHMGGEDFSAYLLKVPGCFFFIGTAPQGAASYPALHNDRYNFTDEALAVGMRMFVELIMGAGSL